jgi:hypothetical protein
LRSPSHYVKMSVAICQIERQLGNKRKLNATCTNRIQKPFAELHRYGTVCAVRLEGKSATMYVTVFVGLLLARLSAGKLQQVQADSP